MSPFSNENFYSFGIHFRFYRETLKVILMAFVKDLF